VSALDNGHGENFGGASHKAALVGRGGEAQAPLVRAQRQTAICVQTTTADVSVAQVARRYALNANMIFKWPGEIRHAPGFAQGTVVAPVFLPAEITPPARAECVRPDLPNGVLPDCLLQIGIAGGHWVRVSGS